MTIVVSTSSNRLAATASEAAPYVLSTSSQKRCDDESPSFDRSRSDHRRAFELKFLLSPEQAFEIEAQLAPLLSTDSHADEADDRGYRVTTIYCDTPRWDVYHRAGRHKFVKLRLRRYGQAEEVFLERKLKRGDRVLKFRSSTALETVQRFAQTSLVDGNAARYHRQLLRNELRPACLVEYHRKAFFHNGSDGPIRLTFDRGIQGGLIDDWSFRTPEATNHVLDGQVVGEFKFRGPMPTVFKSVVESMQLVPGRVSKYRLCVLAAGADVARRAADA
jgi:SPX domain protein involved in polyphosphate accumulation